MNAHLPVLPEEQEKAASADNAAVVRAALSLVQSLWLCAKENEETARGMLAVLTPGEFEFLIASIEDAGNTVPDMAHLFGIPSEWLENRDRVERLAERQRETAPVNDA